MTQSGWVRLGLVRFIGARTDLRANAGTEAPLPLPRPVRKPRKRADAVLVKVLRMSGRLSKVTF